MFFVQFLRISSAPEYLKKKNKVTITFSLTVEY